jgi:hypothetical protein
MRRLAWALLGFWLALIGLALAFSIGEGDHFAFVLAPALGAFAVVGALIASRHPENAIGWLLEVVALTFAFTTRSRATS